MIAIAATQVFTGSELLGETTVHIANGRITDVTAGGAAGAVRLEGLLAPGLVDVQVNGGGGVLFNDTPNVDALQVITEAHARFGVTAIMATLISDARDKIAAAFDAVERAVHQGMPGLLGLHVEGPWLSSPRRGVHPEKFLRALDGEDMRQLTRQRLFPVMVTLAPEQASPEQVKALADAGVVMSIGHTAASHEAVEALLSAGVRGFTHLFNAMPPLEGRNPGPVGAALANRDAWAGLILDGIHVHPLSARAAFAAKSAHRMILVSDAMATVGSAEPDMTLFGERIAVSDGALRTASGTLAGAHLDLSLAVRNATTLLGATPEQALRMASTTPAEFLQCEQHVGRIAVGNRADLVLLDDRLNPLRVWISGQLVR